MNALPDNTGMTADEVRELQKSETWLTPSEALERGIATAILADTAPKHAQDAKRQILQRVLDKAPAAERIPEPEPEQKEPPQEEEKPTPSIMQMLGDYFTKKEE